MKERVTKKYIMRINQNVIELCFCEAQFLLRYSTPSAYTAGVYGWNADVYDVGADAVVTGYRPFGTVRPDPDLVRRYDAAAERICTSDDDWTVKAGKVRELLRDFVGDAIRSAPVIRA